MRLHLRNEGIDITGYSENDLQYLLNISRKCARQIGVPLGLRTGLATAVVGGTVTIGTMTMPTYVAGFLAGFAGGTISCVMGRGAIKPALDQILKEQP